MVELSEMRIRRRHRLRQKEVAELAGRLDTLLGTRTFNEADPVEIAEIYGVPQKVYMIGNEILALELDESPFLYLRGLIRYGASRRFVTVDMGAVRYVTNGADVMGPGIVDGDRSVQKGNIVWVREEKYSKPLAIGRCLVEGAEFGSKRPGKFISSLFWIGDRLWKFSEKISSG